MTMIRTLHHAMDAPGVLREVSEVLAPGGAFVLEFANKLNLKAIAPPFTGTPELVALRPPAGRVCGPELQFPP